VHANHIDPALPPNLHCCDVSAEFIDFVLNIGEDMVGPEVGKNLSDEDLGY
jgi:hypothetical protein